MCVGWHARPVKNFVKGSLSDTTHLYYGPFLQFLQSVAVLPKYRVLWKRLQMHRQQRLYWSRSISALASVYLHLKYPDVELSRLPYLDHQFHFQDVCIVLVILCFLILLLSAFYFYSLPVDIPSTSVFLLVNWKICLVVL